MAPKPVPVAFEGFTRLSPNSYIFTPPPTTSTLSNPFSDPPLSIPPPDLILLAIWLDAQPKHIAKYISRFRLLYPSAQIIILTSVLLETLTRTPSNNLLWCTPVVSLLASLPPSTNILLHTLSNGGGTSIAAIASLYQSRTGRALPIRAHILDSSPGNSAFCADLRAFTAGLPKNPFLNWGGKLLITALYALFKVVWWMARAQHPIAVLRRRLNEPRLFPVGAPRAYVYSREDEMVGWRDVEGHVAEARERGYRVRVELFEGSRHVAHMPMDSERYWGIVQEVWKESFEAE